MATQSINGKIVRIERMSVAGGDLNLAKGMKYFINLELDYTDVSEEELIGLASEGSSVRVKAQGKLRGQEELLQECGIVAESASELKESELESMTPIKFNVATDFERETGKPKDPVKAGKSAYSKMTVEQKALFISETMGVSLEEAEAMVQR